MEEAKRTIWLLLIIILFCSPIFSQNQNLLQRNINIQFQENTVIGHIDKIQIQENIVIAFNSSRVDLKEIVRLPYRSMTLEEVLKRLFYRQDITFSFGENKVNVVFAEVPIIEFLTIKGYIRDKDTGEALVGASIIEKQSASSTFSNESGFYSLRIPFQNNEVSINYLGYKNLNLKNVKRSLLNLKLEFDNEIDQIIIEGSVSDNYLQGTGSEKIDLSLTEGFQSMSGDNDLIRAVRISPKVQSGNEGQLGLYVRGGSPDQNLVLFDGIPLYEMSHTAGFSSIFIEESIKDVDFITNGFPARYGGRLSSVMNVRLKDGNQSEYDGSVNFSLPAMKAHLEGPLFSEKTTFNIAAKASYVDQYINGLIGDFINYENIDLAYHDIVGKLTHRFSSTRKVSFSYYTGEDNINLRRLNSTQDEDGNLFETDSENGVRWGSTVWNLHYTDVFTDKLQFSLNVGGINYDNRSNALFSVNSIVNNLSSLQELELRTTSQIKDQMVRMNFDYYANDKHRLKLGGYWIRHEYNPSLFGNDTITTDANIVITSEENRIIADELAFYIEDTYIPHKSIEIYGGLHFSGYNIGLERYRYVQPRFSAVFKPDAVNRFSISYSNMVQYVHLLVNPGIGLPSDFWIPSTETFDPESADQLSISFSRKLSPHIEFSISGYTKSMNNVLEYQNAVDLFFEFVNSTTRPTIQIDPEWRNFVVSGTGTSRGIEFQIRKGKGRLNGWLTYALSKTTRQFDEINGGMPFPYKYDRRHDLNIGAKYKLGDNTSLSINWTYGTGNAFSLATEQILTPFEDIIPINSGERNNFRFPAFSHLDVQFNYGKDLRHGKLTFNVGLYNVYNRRNAYYIYVYDNPTENRFIAYKTSLFPILPNMSLGYSF